MLGGTPHELRVGDALKIPKGTPHYFIAIEDSTVAEWGATPEEKVEKHLETRKIVDRVVSTLSRLSEQVVENFPVKFVLMDWWEVVFYSIRK